MKSSAPERGRLLLVDHFDSFTYNLVEAFHRLGASVEVVRSPRIAQVDPLRFDALILGPGPGKPEELAGCRALVRSFEGRLPILGVCLGHQCLVEAYGGRVVRARRPMHGKASPILHKNIGLFRGLPQRFAAGRYHSLVAARASLPPEFIVTATTEEGEVMGIKHRSHPIEGVQFHPESILSEHGLWLFDNFLASKDVL